MRLHRFFVTSPSPLKEGEQFKIADADLLHQWRKVFRFKGGETLILLDNSGAEHVSRIVSLEGKSALVEVLESRVKEDKIPFVTLFQSIIKGDHFDLVLEKCTELGVSQFVPVIAERSEKKKINLERAKRIVKEASEQSGKVRLPVVHEAMTLESVFELRSEGKFYFTAEQSSALDPSGSAFTNNLKLRTNNFFIGPEGGWTENEKKIFTSNNVKLVSLGDQVLRSETAAIAASSLLLLQ